MTDATRNLPEQHLTFLVGQARYHASILTNWLNQYRVLVNSEPDSVVAPEHTALFEMLVAAEKFLKGKRGGDDGRR